MTLDRTGHLIPALIAAFLLSQPASADAVAKPSSSQASEPSGASFLQRLSEDRRNGWYIADYSFPSPHYRTGWVRDHVRFSPAGMTLEIDSQPTEFQPYSGAEIQRKGRYGYGRYEVIMKPAAGKGLVSSFFTYTGENYGTPHDEIDVEFLGRDTTKMHPNAFINGKPVGLDPVKLGFDAAHSFNLYAFEWEPGRITWYVNDRKVTTLERPLAQMPTHPSLIMANIWTGSPAQQAWHGKPEFRDGARASYTCMSFQREGETTQQCSDTDLYIDLAKPD